MDADQWAVQCVGLMWDIRDSAWQEWNRAIYERTAKENAAYNRKWIEGAVKAVYQGQATVQDNMLFSTPLQEWLEQKTITL